MKCHISLKHAEGEPGEWGQASDLPQYKLAESDSGQPVVRLGDSLFRFNTANSQLGPIPSHNFNVKQCCQKYRLLPKGTVVVMIQE